MSKQQKFDKSTGRDDADARGEHLYPDAQRRESPPETPLERDPDHYAAGADGTQQVAATSPSGGDANAGNDDGD